MPFDNGFKPISPSCPDFTLLQIAIPTTEAVNHRFLVTLLLTLLPRERTALKVCVPLLLRPIISMMRPRKKTVAREIDTMRQNVYFFSQSYTDLSKEFCKYC